MDPWAQMLDQDGPDAAVVLDEGFGLVWRSAGNESLTGIEWTPGTPGAASTMLDIDSLGNVLVALEAARRHPGTCIPVELALNTPRGKLDCVGWFADIGHLHPGHTYLRFRPRNPEVDGVQGDQTARDDPFLLLSDAATLGLAVASSSAYISYRNAVFEDWFPAARCSTLPAVVDLLVEADREAFADWVRDPADRSSVTVRLDRAEPVWLRLDAVATPTRSFGRVRGITAHDVTAATRSRESLRQVIDLVPYLVFAVGTDGVLQFANRATGQFLGTDNLALEGRHLGEVMGTAMGEEFLAAAADLVERGVELSDLHDIAIDARGRERHLTTSLIPFNHAATGTPTLLAVCNDVTRQINNEALLAALGRNMPDLAMITDVSGGRTFVSASVQNLLGWLPEEFMEQDPADTIHPDDLDATAILWDPRHSPQGSGHTAELRLLHRDGTWRWFEIHSVNLASVPAIRGMLQFGRDISDRKAADLQLRHEATHDALTGLLNRNAVIDELERALGDARSGDEPVGTLFVDLDNFKLVNDALGHDAGDTLLRQVASAISGASRDGDTVGRLGGDEFLVVVRQVEDETTLTQVAQRMAAAVEEVTRGTRFPVTVSIGACLSARGETTAGAVVRDADAAMYRAKVDGKARTQVFHSEMNEHAVRRLEVSRELASAMDHGRFTVHFQPVFQLVDGDDGPRWRLRALEVLSRCRAEDGSEIRPEEFVQVAEQTGLIARMGQHVIGLTLQALRRWHHNDQPVQAWINLSLSDVTRPEFPDLLLAGVRRAGLPPAAVGVEITESMLGTTPVRVDEALRRFRDAGLTVLIDDFGTGYSSLGALKDYPVDVAKIDRSFCAGMATDPEAAVIVESVVRIGEVMDFEVVAEGIEDIDSLEAVAAAGCQNAQGWLFARAMPADEVDRHLHRWMRGVSFEELRAGWSGRDVTGLAHGT